MLASASQLPFNLESFQGRFVPASERAAPSDREGRWFLIQNQNIFLLERREGADRIPRGAIPAGFMGKVESIVHFGSYLGVPCWAGSVEPGLESPAGFVREKLAPGQIELSHDLLSLCGLAQQGTYWQATSSSDERLGHNGWALAAHGASGQIHLYAHDGVRGGDFVTNRGAYATGRWHDVAAVARVDRYEIWIDGKRDDGAFFEEGVHALPARADGELRLGTWNHEDGREFRGHLGEIAVFRRDLSPAEIGAIARASGRLDLREDRGAYRGAADLVGYWRVRVDEGGGIPDLSPSGAHARGCGFGD